MPPSFHHFAGETSPHRAVELLASFLAEKVGIFDRSRAADEPKVPLPRGLLDAFCSQGTS